MYKLDLEISDKKDGNRVLHIPFDPEDSLGVFVEKVNEHAGVDGHAVLELALDAMVPENLSIRLKDTPIRHRVLRFHRVCINVHFETDSAYHWFPSQARWALVHRWACRHFAVANDACANLELRKSSFSGPPINERQAIGSDEDCREVWLVKPGAEQNG